MQWNVSRAHGTASEHHSRELPLSQRSVILLEHSDTAVVLGSTQDAGDINVEVATSLNMSVVRRRSGGGAVFLRGGESVWIDVLIPRDDDLWTDDVSESALWLGDAWGRALESLGAPDTTVHRGAMVKTTMSRTICFDGLAPGEVTRHGAKLVGISQRRTRDGARFQCVAYRTWDSGEWRHCLSSEVARDTLDGLAVGTIDASADQILDALSRYLPAG